MNDRLKDTFQEIAIIAYDFLEVFKTKDCNIRQVNEVLPDVE